MAAGSTEAFASSRGSIGCFNDDLLKSTPDKFWAGEVVATASTGGFWEDDPEENVKRRVNELKRKFHQGRTLQIKHLPRDVTEEEVRELLSDFPVQSVQMVGSGTGSGMARVALEDPEMLEDWDRDRVFLLRNQRLPVTPSPTEMMLCIARLPLDYTEEQFTCLVCCCGEVNRSFIMISEKTGDSKGYGFVEYTTKESALHAKNILDGKQIDNWVLCCDWLDSSHVTFESLHSKCLYVDQLPQDFRDMGEFRKVFSSVVNPPYCQIALKNGCPQDWGLVEFNSAEDAEITQVSLNGYQLKGQQIRISYYIPGVRAINLYLKLLNDSGNKGKSALLPDPPAPAVFQQLQNLAKQNPIFAQNLQYIILTQIQSLQSKKNVIEGSKKEGSLVKGNKTGNHAGSSSTQGQMMPGVGSQVLDETGGAGIGNNTRAALVILLAAQMQAQMGNSHPSLLGNPQMLATLQGLLKQGGLSPPISHPNPTASGGVGDISAGSSVGPPQTHPPFRFGHNQVMPQEVRKIPMKNGFMKGVQKVPLLPNPPSTTSPPPEESSSSGPPFSNPPSKDNAASGMMQEQLPPSAQDVTSFWNSLLVQLQNQNNLSPDSSMPINKNGMFDMHHLGFSPENLLIGDEMERANFPIQPSPQHGKVPHPQSHTLESEPSMPFPADMHISGDLQHTINTLLDNAHNLNRLLGSLTNAMQSGPSGSGLPIAGSSQAPQGLSSRPPAPTPPPHISPGFPFISQSSGSQSMGMQERLVSVMLRGISPHTGPSPEPVRRGNWQHIPSPTAVGHQRMPMARPTIQADARVRPQGCQLSSRSTMVPPPGRAVLGSPVRHRNVFPHIVGSGIQEPLGFIDMKGGAIGSPFRSGWVGSPTSFLTSPPSTPFGSLGSPPGGMIPGIWSHPGSPSLLGTPPSGLVTPVGQKRKYDHILPSPEPSPEGNYIGQHSQGIGGHYADSYFKRKKKN